MINSKITKERFTVAVQESKDLLFRLSYGILKNKADAEDAVAETLVRAWERRCQLRDEKKIQKWMIQIVINISKEMFIARERVVFLGDKDISEYAKEVQSQQKKKNIWMLVMEMDEAFRNILLLYYYGGYSVKEIARILHVAKGTVKSRLSRAREELKKDFPDLN